MFWQKGELTMLLTTWNRRDLIALVGQALAVYGDDPLVVRAAQVARLKALNDRVWLTLGDTGRSVLKADLDDAMSDAALDRILDDLIDDLKAQGLDPDSVVFVDPDGDGGWS